MKILVFPQVRANPYQELLYSQMMKEGDVVKYLPQTLSSATLTLVTFAPRLLFWKFRGYQILHLHWPSALALKTGPWRIEPFATFAYWGYLFCLHSAKILGYKIVWTAHNVLPHKKAFPNDIKARQALIRLSDLVIVHTITTLEDLKKIMGMAPLKFVVIPHGNYVGAYPNTMTRAEARKKLKIESKIFVYAYIGAIENYKGIDTLLREYKQLKNESLLIVAGACSPYDTELRKKMAAATESLNVRWYQGRVPENDFQLYFAASDVVVLPFKSVTTSGSTLLALSFGKTVIVPSIGDLANLPNAIAYKYKPNEEDGLLHRMEEAYARPDELQEKNKQVKNYVEKLSWPAIARETHAALQDLLA